MNHKVVDGRTYITLSERNIRHLQRILADGATGGLQRTTEDGQKLVIILESDEEHYKDRVAGPGYNPPIDPRRI